MPSDSYTLTISGLGIPATHAASHTSGGTDAISINASQVTAGTLPVARGGTGVTTSTGSGSNVLSTDAVLVTPTLGTPKAGSVLTNCTGLPLTSGAGVTGILPVAYGGTGYNADGVSVFKFDTTPASTATNAGELSWNGTDKTLDLKLENGVTLQVGQESNIYVHNDTNATIPNGSVVYIYGADATLPAVRLASNNDSSAKKTLGIATQEILSGADGYITTQGLVRALNTSAYNSGTPLYLGTAGALTSTEPTYPATVVRIGIVVVPNVSTGSIYVQPQLFADGRTAGSFTWGATGTGTSSNVPVSGLTASSHVIVQEVGTVPAKFFYSVVCSTGHFNVYALQNSGASVPLSTAAFSYIAFV